jgi:hypothetical protein
MHGLLAWRTPDADNNAFFNSLSLELLTRWLGMTPNAVKELTAQCGNYIAHPQNRVYVNVHTCTARKP